MVRQYHGTTFNLQKGAMMRVFKKIKNDTWWIDFKDEHNKRRRVKTNTFDKVTAQAFLSQKVQEVQKVKSGLLKRDVKITLKDAARDYLETYSKTEKRSWETDEGRIRSVMRYFIAKNMEYITLDEITPLTIAEYKTDRLREFKINRMLKTTKCKTTVRKSTINRELGILRSIFNKMIEWERFAGRNPVAGKKKLFKEENEKFNYFEREELQLLLSHCEEEFKPFIVFSANTGLRFSEQMSLMWHDFDYNRSIIYLSKTKNNVKEQIRLNSEAKDALIAVKKQIVSPSPFIFCKGDGIPFVNVRGHFERAVKASNIKPKKEKEPYTWHCLRHTFGSALAMAGVSLLGIKEAMRHKTERMCLRYIHLSPVYRQQTVNAIDGLTGFGENGTRLAPEPEQIKDMNEVLTVNQVLSAI
jgi:integrase